MSSERWEKRRARLELERVRATEAAMQSYAAVHYNGGVFAEMHSHFDDKRQATSGSCDSSLPPIRSAGGLQVRSRSAHDFSSGAGKISRTVATPSQPKDIVASLQALPQMNINELAHGQASTLKSVQVASPTWSSEWKYSGKSTDTSHSIPSNTIEQQATKTRRTQ